VVHCVSLYVPACHCAVGPQVWGKPIVPVNHCVAHIEMEAGRHRGPRPRGALRQRGEHPGAPLSPPRVCPGSCVSACASGGPSMFALHTTHLCVTTVLSPLRSPPSVPLSPVSCHFPSPLCSIQPRLNSPISSHFFFFSLFFLCFFLFPRSSLTPKGSTASSARPLTLPSGTAWTALRASSRSLTSPSPGYNIEQVLYCTVKSCPVLYSHVLFCAVLYGSALFRAVSCCTVVAPSHCDS